jgi:AraC-like DNA-binding protein
MRNRQDLSDSIARWAPADGIFETALPRIGLVRSSSPTEPIHTLYPPSLCLVAQGRKQVTIGGRAIVYDEASLLVVGIELPVMGAVVSASEAEPFLCLRLEFDRTVLGHVLASWPDEPPSPPAEALGNSAATSEMFDAAVRLLALLEPGQDTKHLAPLVEQEILHRLLAGAQGPLLRQIAAGEGRLGQIDRAVRFIRASYREVFSVEDLAAIAGMSLSAFHAHFRAVTSMTPLQFRNHIRLQEARRLMILDGMTAAEAGFAVGYDSPSQFSRDYARIHRAPPRQDIARLRASYTAAG